MMQAARFFGYSFLLLMASDIRAQVAFSEPIPYGQNIDRPVPFVTTIRQGNAPDLVLASRSPGRIVSLALTGDTVGSPLELLLSDHERGQLAFADMNGDGLEDVVTTERRYLPTRTEIALYLNLGNGQFAPRVAESLNDEDLTATPLAFGDINGDGILEVVHRKPWGYSPSTNTLVDVSNGSVSLASSYYVNSVVCHDLNGDGADEIIIGGRTTPYGTVSYINLAAPTPAFTNLITGQSDVFKVDVVDVNDDGLMDILFGGHTIANMVIFQTAPMVFATGSVPYLTIPGSPVLQRCWYADTDNDNRPELWGYGDKLVIRGNIDPVSLTVAIDTLLVTEDVIHYFRLLDVDHDDLSDLVIITERGDCRVSYGVNDGSFDGDQRTLYYWATVRGEHVCAVPVTGSGRQQALILGNGYATYLNNSAVSFIPQTRHPYSTPPEDISSVGYKHNGLIEADLDQDGSMDLIRVTCSNTCRLGFIKDWKMPGASESCIAPTSFNYNYTEHASVWDWNDDGLLDIVVTGTSRDWAPGSPNVPFHLVLTREPNGTFSSNNTPMPPSFFTFHTDLDHDGKVDVVVPDSASNTLTIYHNMGGGLFEISGATTYDADQYGVLSHAYTDIPAYSNGSISFPFMDVDGDGSIDMIRYKRLSGSMDLYYQSIDLAGTSVPVHWIVLPGNISVYAEALFVDLDLDNDLDFVMPVNNYMRVHMNNGSLPITAYTTIYFLEYYGFDVVPLDADGDGQCDILIHSGANQFHVLYNQTPRAYRSDGTFRLFPNPTSGTLSVDLGHSPAGTARIELFDAMGRTVLQHTTSSALLDLDLGHLTSGVYILRAIDETAGRTMGVQRLVLTDP